MGCGFCGLRGGAGVGAPRSVTPALRSAARRAAGAPLTARATRGGRTPALRGHRLLCTGLRTGAARSPGAAGARAPRRGYRACSPPGARRWRCSQPREGGARDGGRASGPALCVSAPRLPPSASSDGGCGRGRPRSALCRSPGLGRAQSVFLQVRFGEIRKCR